MADQAIERIEFKNKHHKTDFEIVDLQLFFATRPHQHLMKDFRLDFWLIMVITEGEGSHYIDFKKYAYKKGDILFVQKNQVHRFVVNDTVEGYALYINEPFFYRIEGFNGDIFLEFVDKAFGSPIISFDTSKGRTNRSLIELVYKEYNKTSEELSIELVATLFQGFILSLRRQIHDNDQVILSKDYEHFKEYRRLVEAHYMTTRNVEDYTKMMHLSKKTVNQATRNVVGVSAKQYIINRIVLEIKRYLSQGTLMNYEIADLLGFAEAANMTKFFKHYEGVSPKVFREQQMGKE